MSFEIVIPTVDLNDVRNKLSGAVIRHLWSNGFDQKMSCVQPTLSRNTVAAARNLGARAARGEIVVFNDADSICPPQQIRAAIRLAQEAPGLVFAYDLYCRLGEKATALYLADPDRDLFAGVDSFIHNSGSMACVAISWACFTEVGGFDESYVGWGYEDLDFARRCAELWPLRRVSGPVFHLWHGDRRGDDSPADSDPAQVRLNHDRWLAGRQEANGGSVGYTASHGDDSAGSEPL